jgi:hypothetical protein
MMMCKLPTNHKSMSRSRDLQRISFAQDIFRFLLSLII